MARSRLLRTASAPHPEPERPTTGRAPTTSLDPDWVTQAGLPRIDRLPSEDSLVVGDNRRSRTSKAGMSLYFKCLRNGGVRRHAPGLRGSRLESEEAQKRGESTRSDPAQRHFAVHRRQRVRNYVAAWLGASLTNMVHDHRIKSRVTAAR